MKFECSMNLLILGKKKNIFFSFLLLQEPEVIERVRASEIECAREKDTIAH